MTDQLHDLLARIADDAGPGPADPSLWGRARRARQVRRRQRVVAAVAAGLAAVAALTAVGPEGASRRDPDPVDQPDRSSPGPGVPSVVYGVPGDGGLDLETDLSVGRASVAVTNPTGAYVVTADDGAYHRLRLPGYDAAAYDAQVTGLALSPDAPGWPTAGRRLRCDPTATRAAPGSERSTSPPGRGGAPASTSRPASPTSTSSPGTCAGRRTAAISVPASRSAR